MNYHQLIKAIQENGAFSDRHDARKATEERDDVIAQLPADFADLLPASG